MYKSSKSLLLIGAVALLAGCATPATVSIGKETPVVVKPPEPQTPTQTGTQTQTPPKTDAQNPTQTQTPGTPAPGTPKGDPVGSGTKGGIVVSNPTDIKVVVNKKYMLPDGYKPADLVEPKVPFIFKEQDEKRLMRKEAAQALEQMFVAAKKDGVNLAGVSGYRSYETQTGLFNYYVQTQGEETARKYSAEPGHSEHQTGLSMDVSGTSGACAADDCFAGTPEANWLAAHGAEYGFVVRYPKGKESITGYAYEPWHMRYVGVTLAKEIMAKGLTLEEYFKL
jgi:D-alanyl-D-alanine carboxypeptidase